MKKLKRLILIAVTIVAGFATIVYSSCKKDKCKGVTCLNGGGCNDGICSCPPNYKGAMCQTAANTTLAATYIGIDCYGTTTDQTVIADNYDPAKIYFVITRTGVCAATYNLAGTISSYSSTIYHFTCAQSIFIDGCGNVFQINASGKFDDRNLNMILNVTLGSSTASCSFNGFK